MSSSLLGYAGNFFFHTLHSYLPRLVINYVDLLISSDLTF